MIIVAIGSNLDYAGTGGPRDVCEAALDAMRDAGIGISAVSPWYRSAAMPASDQPDYVNGVAAVTWRDGPVALMERLHEIEAQFGRGRSVPNAARTLDLDLIDYDGAVREGPDSPVLPHPRLADRAFVLLPLADVVPGWRHPVSGATVQALLSALPPGQKCARIGPFAGG